MPESRDPDAVPGRPTDPSGKPGKDPLFTLVGRIGALAGRLSLAAGRRRRARRSSRPR